MISNNCFLEQPWLTPQQLLMLNSLLECFDKDGQFDAELFILKETTGRLSGCLGAKAHKVPQTCQRRDGNR
jgi:hypothetical protein